jgi:NAD-dependent deacetylase
MRILVLTGAGVSAESGIPTFRGKDGYWRNVDPTKLATPEAFACDPELVWEWYRERQQRIRSARPNAAHEAVARLAEHANEFLLVTQNVDDLHTRGGIPAEKMVQIHGNIFVTRCSRCEWRTQRRDDADWWAEFSDAGKNDVRDQNGLAGARPTSEAYEQPVGYGVRKHVRAFKAVPQSRDRRVPRCPDCDALLRPGVVWFGEQLPSDEVARVENFLNGGACEVVIVAGTTATFGYVIDWAVRASQDGELIEVNPEETALSGFATRLVREAAAIALPRIVNRLVRSEKT